MNAASSLRSISAACEYRHTSQLVVISCLWHHVFFPLTCQDPRVHLEQIKPSERRSSELSHEAGDGVWPHPPGPGWTPPGRSGQTSVCSRSNCQAVYGDARARQHVNRGPNEPPPSLDEDGNGWDLWLSLVLKGGWTWTVYFSSFSSRPCLIPHKTGVVSWGPAGFSVASRSPVWLLNRVSPPQPSSLILLVMLTLLPHADSSIQLQLSVLQWMWNRAARRNGAFGGKIPLLVQGVGINFKKSIKWH